MNTNIIYGQPAPLSGTRAAILALDAAKWVGVLAATTDTGELLRCTAAGVWESVGGSAWDVLRIPTAEARNENLAPYAETPIYGDFYYLGNGLTARVHHEQANINKTAQWRFQVPAGFRPSGSASIILRVIREVTAPAPAMEAVQLALRRLRDAESDASVTLDPSGLVSLESAGDLFAAGTDFEWTFDPAEISPLDMLKLTMNLIVSAPEASGSATYTFWRLRLQETED